jgi:hypothetical protein
VVAVASPAVPTIVSRRRGLGWTGGAAAVLIVGLGARLLVGGSGVGDRSALVMATLLAVAAWLATRLIAGPRAAFLATLGLTALFDVAALPRRAATEYDGVEAWYRSDQVMAAHLARPTVSEANLTLLVQPVFGGAQPSFGLAGEVNGASLRWACPFARDIQRLALPLPREAALDGAAGLDVRLHLTGSPTRETDYLLLYTSSQRGGPLISIESGTPSGDTVTTCSLS